MPLELYIEILCILSPVFLKVGIAFTRYSLLLPPPHFPSLPYPLNLTVKTPVQSK